MYIAKRRGKGGHEFFEPDMHLAALKRLELKAELEQALERNEFVIHYQPAVDLASGRITARRGARALGRIRSEGSCRRSTSSRSPRRPA